MSRSITNRVLSLALLLLLTLGQTLPVWAAMALVQSDCDTFAATSQTSDVYTFPSTLTAGNLVVFGANRSSRTVTSIVGNVSFSGTQLGATTSWGGGTVQQWYGIAAGADASVTVNYTGAVGDAAEFCFAEFSGSSSDQSGATTNGATESATQNHDSGSVTPPTAENVVVVIMSRQNDTYTDDGAFTSLPTGNANYHYWGYRIQSSATAQEFNATSTINRDSGIRIGAFAGTSGGGGGGSAPRGLLLGVW